MLNTVRPKITRFCMLSERNTGSNWVAALLQVTSPDTPCVDCWAAQLHYIWASLPLRDPSALVMHTCLDNLHP